MAIADDLEEAYAADDEIVDLVRQVHRGKLTNIGRFFSPDVLAALHFELKTDDGTSLRERTLWVRHTPEQLRQFFAWALKYILDRPVDAYKNAAIRQAALLSVRHLLPSLSDASTESFRLVDRSSTPESSANPEHYAITDTNTDQDASNEANSPSGPQNHSANESSTGSDENEQRDRSRKPEARPERYLLQGLRLPNSPERVQRLLKECRSLDLEIFPGIACVMMRVIVELCVSSPQAMALSGSIESAPLTAKIRDMLKYLDPDIEHSRRRDQELAQAYLEASELGVQYLNAFIHNPAVSPDPHLARRFSVAFRPLLVRVDGSL